MSDRDSLAPIVIIVLDRDYRGMESLAARAATSVVVMNKRELTAELAQARSARRAGSTHAGIVVLVPSGAPELVPIALAGGAIRVAAYHVADAPRTRWTEIGMRASGALIDWTIAPDEASFKSAIRLGADPDRIDVVDVERIEPSGLFATIVREPARRRRSGGVGEAAASLALDGLELSGLLGVIERLGRQRKGVNVVNYHRVLPVGELRAYGRPQMAIAEPLFEAQIEALAHRGFTPVEAVRDAGSAGKTAITFDDGYEDNFRVALPILQRFSAPACFFLVTALIGEPGALWWDRVGLSLFAYWRGGARTPIPDDLPRRARALEHVESFHEARDAIAAVLTVLNGASRDQRELAIAAAERLVQDVEPSRTMLSWDEVSTMRALGLTFGAHTRSHVCLDEVPPDTARRELMGSVEDIEAHLTLPSEGGRLAALPRGRLGPLADDELRTLGFASVMSTTAGVNDPRDTALLVKRRDGLYLTLHGRHHPAKLRLELSGLMDKLRPRVHE